VGDLGPLVAAIITSIATLGAAAFGARRWAKVRNRGDGTMAARWRDQADLEKARADLLDEQLDDERAARMAAEAKLGVTQHDLDDCARQRDNAFSELRQVNRRRIPRTPRVDS
jgi:hypothetical protein